MRSQLSIVDRFRIFALMTEIGTQDLAVATTIQVVRARRPISNPRTMTIRFRANQKNKNE